MTSDDIAFSIIVLSYNYESLILDNLRSILNQTCQDFEVIVIDDFSTDNSYEIINEFIAKCDHSGKISFSRNERNLGMVESYKIAISKCKFKYVCFCEADDYWDSNYIQNLKKFIYKTNASFIVNKVVCVNQSSNSEYDSYVENTNQFLLCAENGADLFKNLLVGNCIPTFSAVCIDRTLLNTINFNPIHSPYLDYWLWRQISINTYIFYNKLSSCFWRKHDKSYDMLCHLFDLSDFIFENSCIILNTYKKTEFINLVKFIDKHISKKIAINFLNSRLLTLHKRLLK